MPCFTSNAVGTPAPSSGNQPTGPGPGKMSQTYNTSFHKTKPCTQPGPMHRGGNSRAFTLKIAL